MKEVDLKKISKKKTWKNSIVGYDKVNPEKLVPNPENWRLHGELQQKTMNDVLSEVGWIQNVIVNKTTGRIVDGHLRVSLALARGEKEVPVTYVELSEEDEKKALATLDPLSGLADADIEAFSLLADTMETDSLWIKELLRKTSNDILNDREEDEEEEENPHDKEIQEMELAPFEHYDYIVFMFRNDQDFSGACEKLGIEKASMTIPDSNRVKIGLGRVVDGAKAIAKLQGKQEDEDSDTEQGAI